MMCRAMLFEIAGVDNALDSPNALGQRDGLAPDHGRIRKDFPYYGAPYTAEEQVGVTPMPRPAKK
jgi:hypothetical protein